MTAVQPIVIAKSYLWVFNCNTCILISDVQ